jgi:hypothetical protein
LPGSEVRILLAKMPCGEKSVDVWEDPAKAAPQILVSDPARLAVLVMFVANVIHL